MKLFSFCESIHAGPLSPWHIRAREENMPLKFGGGIQTPSLCGRVKTGWDLEGPLSESHFHHTCKECLAAYAKEQSMNGPISPKEVKKLKAASLPEEVFDVFNAMIAKNWDGFGATFTQSEVAEKLAEKMNITSSAVYSRRLLDVEEAYSLKGWRVDYYKPDYNEAGEARFVFTPKAT